MLPAYNQNYLLVKEQKTPQAFEPKGLRSLVTYIK